MRPQLKKVNLVQLPSGAKLVFSLGSVIKEEMLESTDITCSIYMYILCEIDSD